MDPWCVSGRWTVAPCHGGLWTWKAGGGQLASGVQASGWLLSCERRAGGAGGDRGG
uniref:Uncharacterized protein n=1 Tax=Fagus sylvatica TaxID=28930 RepID=A0A2N9GCR7_FAGSY